MRVHPTPQAGASNCQLLARGRTRYKTRHEDMSTLKPFITFSYLENLQMHYYGSGCRWMEHGRYSLVYVFFSIDILYEPELVLTKMSYPLRKMNKVNLIWFLSDKKFDQVKGSWT